MVASQDMGCFFRLTLESFRFKDEADYEYARFNLKFFRILSKNIQPPKASLYHFSPEKLVGLLLLEKV